jgi:phage gp16-like protein
MTAGLRRTIFAGCKSLGLDDEARRDLQLVVTGKDSLSAMSEAEMERLVAELRKRGFKPASKAPAKARGKRAPRADLRFAHVLWRLLGEAGKLDNPTREGLNAFVRRRFGKAWGAVPLDIDDLQDWEKIDPVVQALKDWCKREGVAIDWGRHAR